MTKKNTLSNLRKQSFRDRQLLNTWKQILLKQYNYKCFLTNLKGTSNDPLICHHLFSWSDNKQLRYNITNGVVLKKSVHKELHDIYGYGYNTKAQFEQFCKIYYNVKVNFLINSNHEPIVKLEEKEGLKTFREQKHQHLECLLNSRNHKLISGYYTNHQSPIRILCLEHIQVYYITFTNYFKSKTGLKCCGRKQQSLQAILINKNKSNKQTNFRFKSKFKSNLKKFCQNKYQIYLILKKLKDNQHQWLTGTYQNSYSKLTFNCLIHHTKQTINWKNYERNCYGLKCCSQCYSKRWH